MAEMPTETAATDAAYTIDELAALTGVPSRTIRFYQAKGVLPAPRKQGRVAIYGESHADRLKVVSELQDKGLRLRAIRDVVTRPDVDGQAIQEWLGVGKRMGWSQNVPQLLTEAQIRELLGEPKAGTISRLARKGAFEIQGEGANARYLVKSPGLLKIAVALEEAGIDLETAVGLHDILQKRLSRAAEEVVEYATSRIGQGFADSTDPDDVKRAIEALFPKQAAGDAVRLIFGQEIDRVVTELLQGSSGTAGRRRRGRRGLRTRH